MPLQREQIVLTAGDGGQSVLHRISGANSNRTPVVMVPGMFSAAKFWISPRDIGLAAWLAEQGHPCWIHERRSLGHSAALDQGQRNGLNEALRHDLPAVQQRVAAHEQRAAAWIGHSFGGLLIARALGSRLDQEQVAGAVLFATQYQVGKPGLSLPATLLVELLGLLLGRFPARRLGMGSEDEPVAAMRDGRRWARAGRKGNQIRDELRAVRVPVLSIVGSGDTVDPATGCRMLWEDLGTTRKTFRLAGEAHGYRENYSHPGIVVSKSAREEIWPEVADWLAGL